MANELNSNQKIACPKCSETLLVSLEDSKKLCKSCNSVVIINEDSTEITEEKYLTEG